MSPRLVIAALDRPIWSPSEGISEESKDIISSLKYIQKQPTKSISFSWRDQLRDEVAGITHDCENGDWDGYDAEPISAESASGTFRVIDLLPEHILLPDVVPEPTGEIALEWRVGEEKHFTLSVSGRSIVYAGIFGHYDKQYGEEQFFNVLPSTISRILTRYFLKA